MKDRVNTMIDRDLKAKLIEKDISYADALQLGAIMLLGDETFEDRIFQKLDAIEKALEKFGIHLMQ